ncbi:hypothetical protein [Actinokineospora inagensis]|uniref:hypothetical protein n=1 Tax=Actinokineospora inagensis TaxID=103730 RepID=UPI0012F7CD13|nr:hypothetical protein [Actinokineospora inagensis]
MRASQWLWEIYGPDAATELLSGAESVNPPLNSSPVRDACRRLAQLTWIEAWWPASTVAAVPAIDPVVLKAELALATAAIDHLLDDENATTRALTLATRLPDANTLAAQLNELADTHGVTLPEPVTAPSQSNFALAAAGPSQRSGLTILSGASPIDWSAVPAGAVDAAATAEWLITRRDGSTFLEVTVLPGPTPTHLLARFDDVDLALDRVDNLGRLTGQTPIPATLLLSTHRTLTIHAPGFAPPTPQPDPDRPTRQAALIAYAKARTQATNATTTERQAGTQ